MPYFEYTCKDAAGGIQKGMREAVTERELAQQLREGGFVVLRLRVVSRERMLVEGLPPGWSPSWLQRVRATDVEDGLRQLASMLRAGLSLLQALRLVEEQAQKPRVKKLWRALAMAVSDGQALSLAMREREGIFVGYVAELVAAGEQTGELDAALDRAVQHLVALRELRGMVVSALQYPALAITAALAVSVYLVVAVLPKLEQFLGQGGVELPEMTRLLLDLSAWLRIFWWIPLLVVLGLWVAVRLTRMTAGGSRIWDAMLLRLPLFGRILRIEGTAVAARGFSMLSESGVTLPETLRATSRLLKNRFLSQQLEEVRHAVIRGETLASALRARGGFLPVLGQMAAVAESTGTLGQSFAEAADYQEKELKRRIKQLSTLLEPVILCVTAVIVGFVYISFFLALFAVAGVG